MFGLPPSELVARGVRIDLSDDRVVGTDGAPPQPATAR
jgi:hypothetical protein